MNDYRLGLRKSWISWNIILSALLFVLDIMHKCIDLASVFVIVSHLVSVVRKCGAIEEAK